MKLEIQMKYFVIQQDDHQKLNSINEGKAWRLNSICIYNNNSETISIRYLNELKKTFKRNGNIRLEICKSESKWSSFYPDPKSDILDFRLQAENRKL
jgi:hypothetical protein